MALQPDLLFESTRLLWPPLFCGVWFYLWLATTAWLAWALRRLAEQRQEKRELMAALAGSARGGQELSELRDRLNPHFLFNAINTIRFYARTDALVARDLLLDLSDFLKGAVDTSDCGTLAEELDRGLSYLRLEQARLGERLQLALDVEDPPLSLVFPTRVFQPLLALLLERAPGSDPEDWRIEVRCQVEEAAVRLTVVDNRPGPVPAGNWLSSLESRLVRQCPGGQLIVEQQPDNRRVTIILPRWRNP
jgi:LytS/YehU family sensor histidine kinase